MEKRINVNLRYTKCERILGYIVVSLICTFFFNFKRKDQTNNDVKKYYVYISAQLAT